MAPDGPAGAYRYVPFAHASESVTEQLIIKADLKFPSNLFRDISEEAKDFMRQLLKRSPTERMTTKQALEHPWLLNAKDPNQQAKLSTNIMNNLQKFGTYNKMKQVGRWWVGGG